MIQNKRRLGLAIVALASFFAGPNQLLAQSAGSAGTVYYIATTGSDATGTGTIGNPYATLPFAIGSLGTESGTLYLMPGEYVMDPIRLDSRPGASDAFLKIRPQGGKQSVKIRTNSAAMPFASINTANLTLADLWFVLGSTNSIEINRLSSNVSIEGCVIDQTESEDLMAPAIIVNDKRGTGIHHITISGSTFLGVTRAAVEMTGQKIDIFHFMGNTVHMRERASQGIKVFVDDYSGVMVTNNIFNFARASNSPFVIEFRGRGKGTKIHLNCFSSDGGVAGVPISNKLATRSVRSLELPFENFAGMPAGGSLRGTCLDIYAQENLGALKKSTYIK